MSSPHWLQLEKEAIKTHSIEKKKNKIFKKQHKLELMQHGVSHIYIQTCIQHLGRSIVWHQESLLSKK